jgi:hypothetical protein
MPRPEGSANPSRHPGVAQTGYPAGLDCQAAALTAEYRGARARGGAMADLTIYLGNKNYSSWSLRPWLVLKQTTVAFDEVVIPLYQPGSRETILKYSPSGRVPALRHGV